MNLLRVIFPVSILGFVSPVFSGYAIWTLRVSEASFGLLLASGFLLLLKEYREQSDAKGDNQ